jgi:hypothetical protein
MFLARSGTYLMYCTNCLVRRLWQYKDNTYLGTYLLVRKEQMLVKGGLKAEAIVVKMFSSINSSDDDDDSA